MSFQRNNKAELCSNFIDLSYTKSAFTLAEVLITLVIIGVIAAVTVPALIQQTQKQEYVAGLKKAYSTLQNSLYRIADNNGYPHGDYTFLNNVDFIDEFAKVANVVKKCTNVSDCFPTSFTNENTTYKKLSGSYETGLYNNNAAITNDGQLYASAKINSSSNTYGISEEDHEKVLYRIIVDLNGWKKPNQMGYDTFWFYLVDGKGVIPAGSASTSDCVKTGQGRTCAAKVLKENKISY